MGKQEEYLNVIDYSEYPGPRYNSQGPDSGEKFYVEKLNPVFSKCIECGSVLVVNLDGTAGFASSFLDEAIKNSIYGRTRVAIYDKGRNNTAVAK